MFGHKTRGVAIVLTLLSLPASEAHACNWLRGCFGGGTTVNYAPAPYVASYAPAGCGQVVNYMPQTCYRTVYVQTPVVAYRPMSACDPCTGCPTTVMRPVTSCVMQPRLVPYTTYRPVVTAAYTASYAPACNSCAPAAPACNSCAPAAVATPTYYAPSVPVAPATPSCCNASYTPQSAASYAQPAATYSQPAATYSQPAASYPPVAAPGTTVRSLAPTYAPATSQPSVPSYSPPATLSAPTLSNVPPNNVPQSGTGNQTFEAPNEFKPAQPQSRVITPIDEPAADESPNSNTSAPRLFNQQHLDRSAALPIRKASLTKAPTVTRSVKQLDDSGWHAGRN